jgi:hypothetical protein
MQYKSSIVQQSTLYLSQEAARSSGKEREVARTSASRRHGPDAAAGRRFTDGKAAAQMQNARSAEKYWAGWAEIL